MKDPTRRDKDMLKDHDRDDATGTPTSQKVGVAGGAFAGGAAGGVAGAAIAGAAVGTAAGPAGTIIGAAIGAVGGAYAGKAIANRIDPSAENEYWQSNYSSRPYIDSGASYDDYEPAYRYGYERYPEYRGRSFDDVEHEFSRDWESTRGKSRLSWDQARSATRDAYQRVSDSVERAMPGDSDRDGK